MIINLSDIHIKSTSTEVPDRAKHISGALKSKAETDKLFVVISGDIAFSGKQEEYYIALEFFIALKDELRQVFPDLDASFILVPGNHDCDFSSPVVSARAILIDNFRNRLDREVLDETIVELCCSVQQAFRDFEGVVGSIDDPERSDVSVLYSDKLLSIVRFNLGKFVLDFNLYNTAWMSSLEERYGGLVFPVECYRERMTTRYADVSVSVLHHPPEWFAPHCSESFRSHLESTSDVIIHGHNHHLGQSQITNHISLEETVYISSSAFVDDWSEINGFGTLWLDLSGPQPAYEHSVFSWRESGYVLEREGSWIDLPARGSTCGTDIAPNFLNFLTDTGAHISHPRKSPILQDLYVFPDVRDLDSFEVSEGKEFTRLSLQNVLFDNSAGQVLVVLGCEQSGKSAFCKQAYLHYHSNGFVPLLLEGEKIKSAKWEDFHKLLKGCYLEQYAHASEDKFIIINFDKIVVIIDDFDKVRLNMRFRKQLLEAIGKQCPYIIMTGKETMHMEGYVSDSSVERSKYRYVEICQFGHQLREQLVSKWNMLGLEVELEDGELFRLNSKALRTIEVVVRGNMVPQYPIFLLTILQALEVGESHTAYLRESAYAAYYDYLILQRLHTIRLTPERLDAYQNLLAHFAYRVFQNGQGRLTNAEVSEFKLEYARKYALDDDICAIIVDLVSASILNHSGETYSFKYKYLHYYFVAKYFSYNISDPFVREQISKLCTLLHREQYANIIMFLTYLSRDRFVIDQIMDFSKSMFNDYGPLGLDSDIQNLNILINDVPKLVLHSVDIRQNREKSNRARDEISGEVVPHSASFDSYGDNGDEDSEIDVISQINVAFKTTEVLGQILRNYYGSLPADLKKEICTEAFAVGLRALHFFMNLIISDSTAMIDRLVEILEQKNRLEEDPRKMENRAKRLFGNLILVIFFVFLRRISTSVGSENLNMTFDQVRTSEGRTSVDLIDLSIKLDFNKQFPEHIVRDYAGVMKNNTVAYGLLRFFVLEHFYMYEVDYRIRQRTCEVLKISTESQRRIMSHRSLPGRQDG